jgi:hypothetical protein
MEAKSDDVMETEKKEAYRRGVAVIILLAFLTISEYWIGTVAYYWWAAIIGIALLKSFFVVRDYMHIGRLFAADEELEA